jgi:hypothetical protein
VISYGRKSQRLYDLALQCPDFVMVRGRSEGRYHAEQGGTGHQRAGPEMAGPGFAHGEELR